MTNSGFLVLETGEVYSGLWNSPAESRFERVGEVVFNTSHSGYEEIATDPSYFSQIVVMTAPMQGNYGVSEKVWESRQIWIEGFVCLQMMNSERENSWANQLAKHNVPCLSEIDTRAITLRLRSGGTPWGAVVFAQNEQEAKTKAQSLLANKKKLDPDWVWLASRKQIERRKGLVAKGPKLGVLDFGCKENILRELVARCSELVIFPARTEAGVIAAEKLDGLMLTNGPGDPAAVEVAPQTVQKFLGKTPIFGICMGHQVLGLAVGAKTYKMKFGHRGSNHPIQDKLLEQVYMTSQNHGYAVDAASLPPQAKVTHVNLNDQTVAGFYNADQNYLGIQYHPESHPGPHEATGLFDFFVNKMILQKSNWKQGS